MRLEGEIAGVNGRPAGSARVGDSGPAEDPAVTGQTLVGDGGYTTYGAPLASVLPSITF
jgi:hypothetical protein